MLYVQRISTICDLILKKKIDVSNCFVLLIAYFSLAKLKYSSIKFFTDCFD